MKNITLLLLLTLVSFGAKAEISHEDFLKLVSYFHKEYDQELIAKNQKLYINQMPGTMEENQTYWDLDIVRASYFGYVDPNGTKNHNIYFFGGYAHLKYMGLDGITMALCHELGHGIADGPVKDIPGEEPAAVEGEADYFAARSCMTRIFKYYNTNTDVIDSPYAINACEKSFSDKNQKEVCLRQFRELESEKKYFADIDVNPDSAQEVFFDQHDPTIVTKIETDPSFYPAPQCRFDTMMNGILNLDRPLCWWKE